MAQFPIINGIYAGENPDIRVSYPVNLIPVPKNSGVSSGFLRPGYGLVANGVGPGVNRGGIEWNGICYRVMGTKLIRLNQDGTHIVLGDVGGLDSDLVTMDYSFDRLAIVSGNKLYYWIPSTSTFIQVTDVDVGDIIDLCWVDGYFLFTDGEFIAVTELTDPTQVNPLKYGSAESDPDPVIAVLKLRNEVYAINRHTIEVFDNVGGDLFPFQRIEGAQIQKGAVGTHACCVYVDQIAFLGSGRDEPPAVHVGSNANTTKVSTDDIDKLLRTYTDAQLAAVKLESHTMDGHRFLYVHLPDRTLAYDATATAAVGEPVWFTLTTTLVPDSHSRYLARDFVWCYGKWLIGDPSSDVIGYLDESTANHWGEIVRWEFGTMLAYNESKGAIFHEMELVTLNGYADLGLDPQVATSYSVDGRTWSQDKWIKAGTEGDRLRRLRWMRNGIMRSVRAQRFRGDSSVRASFVRLEVAIEPLGV